MTLIDRAEATPNATTEQRTWIVRTFGPAWPLKVLLLGFPVWWVLGLASFAGLIAAAAMAVQMARRRTLRVPVGFGLWVLFLVWMIAGVFLLWAHAPGTLDGGGPERILPFAYRVLWYLAVTVALLYPMNVTQREMPGRDAARWLGVLFMYCVIGGLAGVAFPAFEFTSPVEFVLPWSQSNDFLNALVHPSLTSSSDFLGYEQPRPKAPFSYANAWGNNVGLLLPFFVFSAWSDRRPWPRLLFPAALVLAAVVVVGPKAPVLLVAAVVGVIAVIADPRARSHALVPLGLVLAAIPVVYSLNRGLWLGIGLMTVLAVLALARLRRYTEMWAVATAVLLVALFVVLSPLWATITLRIATPHSNERRTAVAEVVTSTTWQGSPLLGFGTTRKVEGSFASIAGGDNPNCRQCAAPPLGTQGFMWRLVFTTGFVGTGLFLAFLAVQFVVHVRRRDPYSILGCISLVASLLFFFVYDSLETPLFVLMLVVGLMNRERLTAEGDELSERAGRALDGDGPSP